MATVRLKVAPRGWWRRVVFARLDDYVEISDRGVRPSSNSSVWLPPGTIRSITVDQWRSGWGRSVMDRDCPTAHLTDGRLVMLAGLNRDSRRQAEHILIRQGGERTWTPFDAGGGTSWAWGPTDDSELIRRLTALLDRSGALGTGSAEVAAAVDLRALEGHPPDPQIYSLPDLLRALRPNVTRHRRWELVPR